jgi:tetratricopeptide (TPR) repeat protein
LGLSLGLLTLVPILQGDYEASHRLYQEWYEIAVRNGNIQHQAFGLFGQAENLLPMGKAKEAGELTRQGLRLLIEKAARTAENRTGEIRGHGILAIAYLRQGEDELALEAAGDAMAVAAQLSAPTRVTLLEGLSGMCETYLALWANGAEQEKQAPSLKKAAEESCKMIDRFAKVFDIGRPRALLWWGLYHWLDGRPDRANESWKKSQVAAEGLGMSPDQALARAMADKHT